jgi:hypothetical protein
MIGTMCAAALAVAGLTGCAQIDSYSVRDEHATQADVIGDIVSVAGTFCLDDQAPAAAPDLRAGTPSLVVGPGGTGACDPSDAAAALPEGIADDGGVQFFAAFLVPEDAAEPATATGHLPAAFDRAPVTLRRRPSLDETLEHTRPAAAGLRWVGYISPVVGAAARFDRSDLVAAHLRHASVTAPAAPSDGDWSAEADFRPTRGIGGLPVPASFGHAVIGGTRLAYPEALYDGIDPGAPDLGGADRFGLQLLDTRPVDCQELREFPYTMLFGESLDALPATPLGLPLLSTTLCGRPSAQRALALRDLRGSGGTAAAAPGTSATVPFTLRYAGAPGPRFALRATTAIAGATATPSAATLAPAAAGFQDVDVDVVVPAGAAPGDYDVTLVATVGGQVRTAVGTLTVPAPGVPAAPRTADDPGGEDDVHGADVTFPARARLVEFRGFDRSGLGPDRRSINLGDVLCHKTAGTCGSVMVQLSVAWGQLHQGAGAARTRLVVIGAGRLVVPAQGRRRVQVAVTGRARRLLREGRVLHAIVGVRAVRNLRPIVRHVELRGH